MIELPVMLILWLIAGVLIAGIAALGYISIKVFGRWQVKRDWEKTLKGKKKY